LTPNFDAKIWKYEIRTQVTDLNAQLEKCMALIKVLEALQANCARTADNLDNVLKSIKEQLKQKIDAGKNKVKALEAEVKKAKCGFWDAIFSFGASCRAASKLRDKLNSQLASIRH
jgi:DNA repair ATPase RecN